MKKSEIVKLILNDLSLNQPTITHATAYAPTNIALCKYWGKRNTELNLPMTSSLSISIDDKGAETTISESSIGKDSYSLNGQPITSDNTFYQRLLAYLDLFRPYPTFYFSVNMVSTVPIAAGLASSACGFAALALALNKFFNWQLRERDLSILARLGSGSASRSIWTGFVEWHKGNREDGMDSFAESLPYTWPELCIGLMLISDQKKPISSREAMQRTIETSELYKAWPLKVAEDLPQIKHALQTKNFELLGKTVETNALAMHATMISAWPPISYSLPATIDAMHRIWKARAEGINVYFTQDAGPNLKLLFLEKDRKVIKGLFFPTN